MGQPAALEFRGTANSTGQLGVVKRVEIGTQAILAWIGRGGVSLASEVRLWRPPGNQRLSRGVAST